MLLYWTWLFREEWGGKEAMGRLLEVDPGVKAIVSSGYSSDPVMSEHKKHGFRGCIAKPYKIQKLSNMLKSVIEGWDYNKHLSF